LPWLFKKLASHILDELTSGTSQEELLAEALNIQSLFERDLAELSPQEQQALRSIARGAPILASDAVETVGSQDLVQSLVDRRLVVQVGERLDVYWDIFRDFLNTGSVPIRDTYILRVTPGSVSRLLRLVVDQGGDLTVSETANQLGTTEGVVFNLSRELRMMGVLEGAAGHVRLVADIREAGDIEGAVRERISSALKRNTAFALLSELIDEKGGIAALPDFAELLPTAFPAVQAVPNTWLIYARAFAQWFAYARLVSIEKGGITLGSPAEGVIELLGAPAKTRVRSVFPQSPPGPALLLAQILAGFSSDAQWTKSRLDKAVNDLVLLGFAEVADEPGVVTGVGVSRLIDEGGTVNRDVLRQAIAGRPGGDEALRLLEDNPNTPAMEVGAVVGAALGAAWSDGTKQVIGKFFRAWARETGIQVAMPRRRRTRASG
jgi:hypothetical protein